MSNSLPQTSWSWKRSRYGFAAFHVLTLMAAWSVLRLILYLSFGPPSEPDRVMMTFLAGLHRDLFAALALTLPLLLWMLLMPQAWRNAKWFRIFFWTSYFAFWFFSIFILFVEYFFFDE